MKLIDLLVHELPKRGGWPAGVDAVEQDGEGQLFEMESDYCSDFKLKKCDDWIADVVTRQQYESALATSQKPVWNGEGVPPVGVSVNTPLMEGQRGGSARLIILLALRVLLCFVIHLKACSISTFHHMAIH